MVVLVNVGALVFVLEWLLGSERAEPWPRMGMMVMVMVLVSFGLYWSDCGKMELLVFEIVMREILFFQSCDVTSRRNNAVAVLFR